MVWTVLSRFPALFPTFGALLAWQKGESLTEMGQAPIRISVYDLGHPVGGFILCNTQGGAGSGRDYSRTCVEA